ncbi:MAG: type III secretion system chaperone [Deltaproteobacteria bacterium]|jgi:hypothetical protein|nr:type III secretion system chaperone [Deltaproteobacteria bacterium]
MNFDDKVNSLLAGLANNLNQPPVVLDESSRASMVVRHCSIFFSPSECRQYLLCQTPITNLPKGANRGAILRMMAASNYSSSGMGGILGIDKDTDVVWLTFRLKYERENPESFLKFIAIQTGLAEYWQKTINLPQELEFVV